MRKLTLVMAGIATTVAVITLVAPNASAQLAACNPANCGAPTMGQILCTAQYATGQGAPSLTGVNNAACTTNTAGGFYQLIAVANTGSPATRTCQWNVPTTGGFDTCTINAGDGLPVELMDFTID